MFAWRRLYRPGLVAMASFLLLSLAGSVSGFAATGRPDAGEFSRQDVSSCRAVPLTVRFQTTYDERLADYGVRAARVTGMDAAAAARCAGMRFKLALSDAFGRSLSQVRGAVPTSTGTFAVDLADAHVAASDVASVHVTIGG
ncbi:MAG: hypothetical protein QOI81_2262 [Actinomycetota bacterium]|nr:hypothetical protein [Actinomycetota bacterium]